MVNAFSDPLPHERSKAFKQSVLLESSTSGQFLKHLFELRKNKNKNYSLRAFSRDIDSSITSVCLYIRGTRSVAPSSALIIAEKLHLNESEKEHWLSLSIKGDEEKSQKHPLSNDYIKESSELNKETFKNFSSIHFAHILSALDLNLKSIPEMEKATGISSDVIKESLKHLLNLGVIEEDSSFYKKTKECLTFRSFDSNMALKNFHIDVLERGKKAILTQDNSQKLVTTATISLNYEQLEEFKDILRSSLKKIVKKSMESRKKNRVYNISIQLFDLKGI